jgi:hypothetical protein
LCRCRKMDRGLLPSRGCRSKSSVRWPHVGGSTQYPKKLGTMASSSLLRSSR